MDFSQLSRNLFQITNCRHLNSGAEARIARKKARKRSLPVRRRQRRMSPNQKAHQRGARGRVMIQTQQKRAERAGEPD